MSAVILFSTTFVLVFSLGFQSLNVNKGHYIAAFLTSFLISGSNLVILRTIPQGDLFEVAAYMMGGPFGIIASMWLHKRFLGNAKQRASSTNLTTVAGHELRSRLRLSFITTGHLTKKEALQAAGMMILLTAVGVVIGIGWARY